MHAAIDGGIRVEAKFRMEETVKGVGKELMQVVCFDVV